MAAGIQLCIGQLSHQPGRNVIDLITDGVPDIQSTAIAQAAAACSAGIEVWTMGIGSGTDQSFWQSKMACGGGRHFSVGDPAQVISALQNKIGSITCLGTAPPPPTQDAGGRMVVSPAKPVRFGSLPRLFAGTAVPPCFPNPNGGHLCQLNFLIFNVGTGPLTIQGITLTSDNPRPGCHFRVAMKFPQAIPPTGHLIIPVEVEVDRLRATWLHPNQLGVLTIVSDDLTHPSVQVQLQAGTAFLVHLSQDARDLRDNSWPERLELTPTGLLKLRLSGEKIARVRWELFDASGRKLQDEQTSDSSLELERSDPNGQPLANGVYLYAITIERWGPGAGFIQIVRAGKLVILR